MSELYFRSGSIKGFTASDLADKKEGYANPIRELLQNSLDASHQANHAQCEINIHIETIPTLGIPHIEEYEETLEKAINTQKDKGSFNKNARRVTDFIEKALKKQDSTVLMFSDNGAGMSQKAMNGILEERSVKEDETSGGSFGVGGLSSYSLSSLRYVLYATKYKDNEGNIKSLFTGSPILAGHTDEGIDRGNRGIILETKPKKENSEEFVYLETFPSFIKPKMDNLDTGTTVAILALSENWNEEAEYAIVSNFFHAIAHESLVIKIHKDRQETKLITDNEVDFLIAKFANGRRATGDNILSGRAVSQAWHAVKENGTQKDITLKNGDKVHVFIKTDKEADSAVVLIRNGMVIARHDSMLSNDINELRKDQTFEAFTAVIDVDMEEAPILFGLVKGAENPFHNKLVKNRLSVTEEKNLKRLFKELSEEIKNNDYLKEIERDSFGLPLFQMPDKAEEQNNGTKSQKGQTRKGKKVDIGTRPTRQKQSDSSKKPRSPTNLMNINRQLAVSSAVRYKDLGDEWEVKLRIVPDVMDAKDDVYLSMWLGEDDDKAGVKIHLDFIAVECNGKPIKITDKKNEIKLGQLEQAKQYNIVAKVEKLDEIGEMKVALLPIFGLKRQPKDKG